MSLKKEDVLLELSEHEQTLGLILAGFTHTRDGLWILPGHRPLLLRCVRETIDLLHLALGKPNEYANRISSHYDHGRRNAYGSQSYDSVSTIHAEVQAVQTHIKRPATILAKCNVSPVHGPMVAVDRINELRDLTSKQFDFSRLIKLCEDINTNYQNGSYFGTAALTRAVLDHVPPIFGKDSFAEVANNYGSKSFKGTMLHLHATVKHIADGHLHSHIRKHESLPVAQQVDFGPGLDVLLAEIIVLTNGQHSHSLVNTVPMSV